MSRKRGVVEIAGPRLLPAGLALTFLAACAHNPMTDPPPRALTYAKAIECAGLMSALHGLGEPEGWTYDRRADMFALWAEALVPDAALDKIAPAIRATMLDYLARFPGVRLTEDVAVLKPMQDELRTAYLDRVYDCETLSPAFDIIVVAGK